MKSIKIAAVATFLTVFSAPVFASSDTESAGTDTGTDTGMAMEMDMAKVKAGEKVFKKCKACHTVGEGAKNKSGPALNGIIGAPAGQNPDFKYSNALKDAAADGLVWDVESLSAFLTKPKKFMKGTKMGFAGLKKEKDVENILAYLSTFQ